jgi:hypothetical protein
VQQGDQDAVPLVVVGLVVQRVVLVQPGDVPGGHARHGHGGDAALAGAHPVFGVVPLEEDRQREAQLADDLRGDQAHPPAVVVGLGQAVQPRGVAQVAAAEVMACLGVGRLLPPPGDRHDGLGVGVQHRPVVHAEHVPADDHRPARVVGEGDGPQDSFGVELDVVIDHEHIVTAPRARRLVHDPGEAARAAYVGLLDDLELVGDLLGRVGEVRVVGDLLGAHVDHIERVQQVEQFR